MQRIIEIFIQIIFIEGIKLLWLCLQQTQVKTTKGQVPIALRLTPSELIYVEYHLCNEAPKNEKKQLLMIVLNRL